MAPAPAAEDLLKMLSGVLLVSLGVFVGSVRPRTRASLLFATFCSLYGLRPVVLAFANTLPAMEVVAGVTQLLAAIVLGAFVIEFPRRISRSEARRLRVPLATAAVIIAMNLGSFALLLASGERWSASNFETLGQFAVLSMQWAFLLVLAARFLEAREAAERRQYALLALGLLMYPAYVDGYAYDQGIVVALPAFAELGIVTIAWLLATRRGGGPIARNVALAIPSLALLGMCMQAFAPAATEFGFPATRTLGVVIMAYSVLSANLFGIDLKVRWAISRSTIAAAFITVFFVASEAAQQFFGETLQSTWLGIAAAGAIVFAMAPLQRAAELLAEKAVPVATPDPRAADLAPATDREASYRHAVELALRERTLSRDEERRLLQLAHHLGIPPARAAEVHDAVEAEQAKKGDA